MNVLIAVIIESKLKARTAFASIADKITAS